MLPLLSFSPFCTYEPTFQIPSNILLDVLDFSADFLYEDLKRYIHPSDKVVILAFSYRDREVQNLRDWKILYGKSGGRYYDSMVSPFLRYGIPEDHIKWIDYYTDAKSKAAEQIRNAGILYLPGGLPDRMMERIDEFNLRSTLLQFQGVVLGYSAGALIQLQEYHLSPDQDYPEFTYFKGLSILKDFYLEVHYEDNTVQNEAIQRVLEERRKIVYAMVTDRAAIVMDGSKVNFLGDVKIETIP